MFKKLSDLLNIGKTGILNFVFAGIISTYIAFATLYREKDYLPLLIYAVMFAVFIFLYFYFLPPIRSKTPDGQVFDGVKRLSKADAWERENIADIIIRKIIESQNKLLLISGTSGVGKSILMSTQVIPHFEKDGWETILFDNYTNIQGQVIKSLSNITELKRTDIRALDFDTLPINHKKLLVVFDQTEQLLLGTIDEMRWVAAFLRKSLDNDDIRGVVIVRQDYFYDLRFLGNLVPSPSEAIELSGLELGLGTEDCILISEKLSLVVTPETVDLVIKDLKKTEVETFLDGNDEVRTRRVELILPIELQIVGLMLEIESKKKGRITKEHYENILQGKNGLIERYFSAYLSSAPNLNVAKALLYVLSIERLGGGGRPLSLEDISRITYYNMEEVKENLDFFDSEQLVIMRSPEIYEWTHDFLCSGFREFSGGEMEPAQRDNITYLVNRMRSNDNYSSNILPTGEVRSQTILCKIAFCIAIVMIPFRIIAEDIFIPHDVSSGVVQSLESVYLPFGCAQLSWVFFVYYVTKSFFIRIVDDSRILPWWLITLTGLACLVMTCYQPFFWALSIGIMGLLISAKYFLIAFRKNISKKAKTRFMKCSITIGAFSIFVCGPLGLGYYFGLPMFIESDSFHVLFKEDQFGIWLYRVSGIIAIISSITAWIALSRYTTSDDICTSLGLLDRGFVNDGADSKRA